MTVSASIQVCQPGGKSVKTNQLLGRFFQITSYFDLWVPVIQPLLNFLQSGHLKLFGPSWSRFHDVPRSKSLVVPFLVKFPPENP